MQGAIRAVQIFFGSLAQVYDAEVARSHGDHVPVVVRNSATYCFWLPDILFQDYAALAQDSFWGGEADGVVCIWFACVCGLECCGAGGVDRVRVMWFALSRACVWGGGGSGCQFV